MTPKPREGLRPSGAGEAGAGWALCPETRPGPVWAVGVPIVGPQRPWRPYLHPLGLSFPSYKQGGVRDPKLQAARGLPHL